jgi:hypothetical protein
MRNYEVEPAQYLYLTSDCDALLSHLYNALLKLLLS